MRIGQYILVLIVTCTLGGVLLAGGLYWSQNATQTQADVANQAVIDTHRVRRLDENLSQWLLWSDLILGSGNTYLVTGALEQVEGLDELLKELKAGVLVAKADAEHAVVHRFVRENAARLQRASGPLGADPAAAMNRLLAELDRSSGPVITSLTELGAKLETHAEQQALDLADARESARWMTGFCSALYLALVVVAWRFTAWRLIRPVRALTEAADDVHRPASTFEAVGSGPREIRRLGQALGRFATELDERLDELGKSNATLELEVAERVSTEALLSLSEQRFRGVFENSNDAIFVIDAAEDRFVDVNPQACSLIGCEKEVLMTLSPSALHEQEREAFAAFVQTVLKNGQGRSDNLTCQTRSGQRIPAEVSASVFELGTGGQGVVALVRDIGERRRQEAEREAMHQQLLNHTLELETQSQRLAWEVAQRKEVQQKLEHDAFHDALTGLPNRRRFKQKIQEAKARASTEPGYAFTVLFIDLDDFKRVNDSLGHDAGDDLLCEVAGRLISCMTSCCPQGTPSGRFVARIGGDEFVVLLEGACELNATGVAEQIQEQVSKAIWLAGQPVSVGVSIGVAVSNTAFGDNDLLRDADTAMYRAKLGGKSRFAIFDQTMHEEVADRLKMEADLRSALEHGGLHLHYQPVVSMETARVVSFEALVRWDRPGHGSVSPGVFVPLAEQTGMILELGRWVLAEACRASTSFNDLRAADDAVSIAVNVSRMQLLDSGFVGDVKRIVKANAIDPRHLTLEVTESMVMSDIETVHATLLELRAFGVRIAMDDFGTGYSSLSCLHEIPLNAIKIDQAFVMSLGDGVEHSAIVDTIVRLADHLGLEVVAEGIETPGQMAQMLTLACDYGQGYLLSRPLTLSEAQAKVNHYFRMDAAA